MAQPLWAMPLMGLMGVNGHGFMTCCALLMLRAVAMFAITLLLF